MSKLQQSVTKAAASAAVRIFLPLVRMLVRHGVPYKTVAEWMRWCYAKVSYEEFSLPGRKPSKSRVAVITGLTRVDVDRLLKQPSPIHQSEYEEYQRAAKVLTGWARDKRYQDKNGKPLLIPFEGNQLCFTELVERYGGGTPPRAVLDELIRVGAVAREDDGFIFLKRPHYVPPTDEGNTDYLDILGHAASGLIDTIDYNTRPDCTNTRLQGLAFNGRIPTERLDEVAQHIKQRGRELVFEIDDYLYQVSLPESDATQSSITEAGIGLYFFDNNAAQADKEI